MDAEGNEEITKGSAAKCSLGMQQIWFSSKAITF